MLWQKINSVTSDNTIYEKPDNLLEYSVEPMIIDPFKSTPPDKFINGLTSRMKHYYNELSEKKPEKPVIK